MSQRIYTVKYDIDTYTVDWQEYYRYFYLALIMNEIFENPNKQNYFFLTLFQPDKYGEFIN